MFLIFLGSGKSSILFCLLCLFFFFLLNLKNTNFYKIILVKFLLIFTLHIAVNEFHVNHKNKLLIIKTETLLTKKYLNNDHFIYPIFNKDFNRLDTILVRIQIYREFLNYYDNINNKKDFFFGQGSLSSIFSGYHNDYLRIFYRTGFLV